VRQYDAQTHKKSWYMTPLFVSLIMVECIDLVFAIDSIPAVFMITQDPYIIYTSNIFAILGLRALYFALASMMHQFYYLKYSLAAVLIFIGSKIFIADAFNLSKIPPVVSLGITFGLLSLGILCSLNKQKE
jgi:tellurite resistance protein TerC